MANFTGRARDGEVGEGTFLVKDGRDLPTSTGGGVTGGVPVVPTEYLQRIFDDTLVAYVYFTRESTDPSTPPLGTGDTQPTNTGNLDLSNHAVLAEV